MKSVVNFCKKFKTLKRFNSHYLPVTSLNEMESAIVENTRKFSNSIILPKVREMDEKEELDKNILTSLFDNGLMGIEIPEKYGGSGLNFMSSILVIEELAKVDPSISGKY